jgi:hypothetical protein
VERSGDVHAESTEDERGTHGEGRRRRRLEGAFAAEVREEGSRDIHGGGRCLLRLRFVLMKEEDQRTPIPTHA